jgi:hypothetical protein
MTWASVMAYRVEITPDAEAELDDSWGELAACPSKQGWDLTHRVGSTSR